MNKENANDIDFQEGRNDKAVMTLTEVAELLRVHRCTISRYAKSGELKSYRIGNRRLFKTQDVWSFFDNQVAPECVSGVEVL